MKIVILDGKGLNPGDISWEEFLALGDVTIYDSTPEEEIINRIGDAEIVITNKTLITRQIIENSKNIKYIGALSTGYNAIDIEAAKEREIIVTNIPAYSTNAVAQFVFAYILEIACQVGHYNQSVKNGDWQRSETFCYWNKPIFELQGKTIGIVGLGNIGKEVAKIAKAFSMNVIAFSPNSKMEGVESLELDELYNRADIITLHLPINEKTEKMINKDSISKMKDGVILINAARGAIIDDFAVNDGLKSGKISYSGLDVLTVEPPKDGNILIENEKTFITPHIAWAPKETRERLMTIAVDNVKAFIKGKPINRVV